MIYSKYPSHLNTSWKFVGLILYPLFLFRFNRILLLYNKWCSFSDTCLVTVSSSCSRVTLPSKNVILYPTKIYVTAVQSEFYLWFSYVKCDSESERQFLFCSSTSKSESFQLSWYLFPLLLCCSSVKRGFYESMHKLLYLCKFSNSCHVFNVNGIYISAL